MPTVPGLLEYSDDPLSDTTPTYMDRSAYLMGGVEWSDGKTRELDDPQAATITFRLSNQDGEWFPNSPDSLYPDSPFLLRRFRWTVNNSAAAVNQVNTNPMPNPGFDTDLSDWLENDSGGASMTPTRDTTVYRTSPGSMKLVNSAAGEDDFMEDNFTHVAGVTYLISAWVNVTAFTAGATSNRGLYVHDSAGHDAVATITAATPGWVQLSVTLTPTAAGASWVRLYAPQGTTYWDDIHVTAYGRQGVWYVQRWQPGYAMTASGEAFSVVDVTCVDGFELLSLDALDLLEPATAATYEEVVMQDEPWGYWRLGDAAGAKMAAASGPDGSYHGSPALGQEGLLLGDSDTAATFVLSKAQYGKAVVGEANQFSEPDTVSVEAWVTLNDDSVDSAFVTGPNNVSFGPIFALYYSQPIGSAVFEVIQTSGATTSTDTPITEGVTYHLVGVWDGRNRSLKLYKDGVLVHTEGTATLSLISAPASEAVRVGRWGTTGLYANATIDEVAVYERPLTAERVLAHYQAGAERGFPEQTAGERIADVADSPLWAETSIQTGEHMVHPVMEHGQSKMAEIVAAAQTEMPDSMFFFDGDGNPAYLAWNYKDGLGPEATFGNGGVPYAGIEPVYDDEIVNEWTVGHEAEPGEETQHTATDTDSQDEFFRRAASETGLILKHHDDAIAVAAALLEKFKDPQARYATLSLNGNDSSALTQILDRQLGDMIRVKGPGVNDSDLVTTILGRSRTWTPVGAGRGHLTCTWTLARGFDAAAGLWQLGISGWSELQTTTVLG